METCIIQNFPFGKSSATAYTPIDEGGLVPLFAEMVIVCKNYKKSKRKMRCDYSLIFYTEETRKDVIGEGRGRERG